MIVFLHMSDLHIGEKPQWVGSFGPRAPTRQPPLWPSMRGHDERVALDLSDWWERKRRSDPSATIIATGDLTRLGRGLDFGCVHRFLHAYWLINPSTPLKIGVAAGGNRALTVPGNHDFWHGFRWPLQPHVYRGVLDAHFWPLPWLHVVVDPNATGIEIHLVGLDSCSGLLTVSPRQVAGKGAIASNQLVEAQILLEQEFLAAKSRAKLVVRVVLVHHPPESLSAESKNEFESWLASNNVHVILSGHRHQRGYPSQSQPQSPFTLRCGTTLQAGTANKLPGPEPNHFYLHNIWRAELNGTDIQWETREWWHNGSCWTPIGFNPPIWTTTLVGLIP